MVKIFNIFKKTPVIHVVLEDFSFLKEKYKIKKNSPHW